jgi:23S rRNA (uracil1939-C5)-methyltransferase
LKRSDETFSVSAERPAYGGLSIARVDGAVLFIKGAIPGETVEARIDEQKKDYAFGSAINIISPSRDRIQPACKHFSSCGGCQLQYISYTRQVSLKEEILLDSVRRGAKLDIRLSASLYDDNPWHYRHRGQFKVSGNAIGFFREKTREVVDIQSCPLMTDEINILLAKVSALLKSEPALFPAISEIHISYGDTGIALLKVTEKPGVQLNASKIVSAMLDAGFGGICIEPAKGRPGSFGKHHTMFDLEGLKYAISPQSFFQGHWRLNRSVVRLIRETLHPLNGKRVVDLYSGAGNFALPLALDAKEVVAIEDSTSAINDGKRNAKLNNIDNCRFIKCAAEQLDEVGVSDVLVLDPPRAGLTNMVLNKILALEPERIAYISCNPSTFARDLKKLLIKYEMESLRLIDFFPQTYHIESVCFLRLR